MNAYKDGVNETGRVKEEELKWKEVQMADRHAVASGNEEKQHGENIMRDIHVGICVSETANEEQPDKFRKTARFEQEASESSSSSLLNILWVVRNKTGRSPYLCRLQVMLTMTHIFCVGCVVRVRWTKGS